MDLKKGSKIHLMGICGTAMASLAGLLKDKGFVVTGSDSNPYPPMSTQIENLGIKILSPYSATNLNSKPDFVIVGNVISANNPEAQELVRLNIPFTSLPKALGEWIIADKDCICISGTHGKTTTTSMMSWVMEKAELKPGFLIGGIPKNFSQSFKNPEGKYFVIEGDEYDTAYFDKVPKFIHYKPKHVILTSIEFDHADIYKDLDDVKKSFTRLLKIIPTHGSFIYWSEDKNIRDLLDETNTKNVYSYGFDKRINAPNHAQCEVKNITEQSTEFIVKFKETTYGPFSLNQSGNYNVLNATSVILMALNLGVSEDTIKNAFLTFQGVKRRQEILGTPGGRVLIEDFAHHPTAVKETLKGIQAKYKDKKIIAIFEPRSATSRRKIFQQDYVKAFSSAQQVHIMEAFDQSKIQEDDRFSSQELVDDLNKLKPANQSWAYCHNKTDEIVKSIKVGSQAGDIIVVMSNGGFDGIYRKITQALS